ncbi:MAG TPA: RDD family protein, partial [Thermoanaerobaculia bacterium]|nr:RDD family protein [Thermoanaerobaculia bacterium]
TLLRIAAFLVDALSMSLLLILPGSFISYSMAWFGGSVKAISIVWFVALGVLVLGMLLRDGYRGRSLGKQLLGLRLVTPRGDGCGWGRSIVRNALLVLFPIEMVLVLRGKPRLGDRVARTVVTEE